MSRKALLGILIGSAGLMLACLCTPANLLPFLVNSTPLAPTLISTGGVPAAETVVPGASPACLSTLSQDLYKSETTYLPGAGLEADFTLVTYRVSGDSILDPLPVSPIPPKLKAFQQDTATQEKMWRFFANIIPADWRSMVTEFSVFTDGPNNSLGAVEQTDDPRHWKLEMDIQDSQNFADLSTTLVHEFGHLLTLNDTQLTPDMEVFNHPNSQKLFDQAEEACPTYFMFEGCSHPDSYINQFFQQFWPKLFNEWKQIDGGTSETKKDQALDAFYERYTDQFVSKYAVTSPEEDIAETFMYFIFMPRPGGSRIADQKVLFFYDQPALKDLRDQILSRLCRYVEKP